MKALGMQCVAVDINPGDGERALPRCARQCAEIVKHTGAGGRRGAGEITIVRAGFFSWSCSASCSDQYGTLNIDRTHAAMGDASYKDVTAFTIGHSATRELRSNVSRVSCLSPLPRSRASHRSLVDSQIDRPLLRFLEQDRGGLQRFARPSKTFSLSARFAQCDRNNRLAQHLSLTSPAPWTHATQEISLSTPSTSR